MCGIAGFYGFKDDALLTDFSRGLAHRGPDGEGFYKSDSVSLLNRRLAIIDLKTGMQPVYNEDKSLVVVYNGEIYNYRQLRRQLKGKHVFKTASDTEVIVHAYEEWGLECFNKFNGMFAIALYDINKEELVLARDHFGIKPLYYSFIENETGGRASTSFLSVKGPEEQGLAPSKARGKGEGRPRLIFSSEITPILESGRIKKKPNEKTLYRYLKYRVHEDTEETFFEGVKKLMPGQALVVNRKRTLIVNYSHLKEDLLQSPDTTLSGEAIEIFKSQLVEAIRLRLISDVKVGTCLSGGLDSSTVATVVNQLLKDKSKDAQSVGDTQNTFSAVFPDGSNNEEKYVDEVVKSVSRVTSHKVHPKPEEFFEEIEGFVRAQEEPTISTGPYAQYKVMETAKSHVKVLLDGQGADEMMAGYIPYYLVYLKQLLKEGKYATFLKEAWAARDVLLNQKLKTKPSVNVRQLLNRAFAAKHKQEKFEPTPDNLKKRLVEDIFHNSLPSLLRYEDKNSMHFSIEGRVPFLDANLLKYIFSLPDEAIIKDGWNKYILRESIRGLVPEKIVKRRNKIGFTTPEYEWFMRMKNRIYQIFLSESFASRPYFNQQEVLRAFRSFIEGKNDDTLLFWRLLNTELWMRIFLDKRKVISDKRKEVKKEITVDGKNYERHLIKTDVFAKGDDYNKKISDYAVQSFKRLNIRGKKWMVVVSEKVVAISQGRSYFLWEITPGFWAKALSKYVKKTPYGIGLGSPWTMQLAIQEAGLPRMLAASLISAVTKPFGMKGIFYQIAGHDVNAIDGPTEYSLYPSNVSAKLGPKDPQQVAEELKKRIASLLHGYPADGGVTMKQLNNFQGVAVIDANDLGVNVLGNSTKLESRVIEKIFKDNPMGQSREQTPICLVSF